MLKSEHSYTLSNSWCREQSDRLMAFEILKRYIRHETQIPISTEDLYDKIGVSKTYIRRLLKSIPEKLNEQ
jgi:hypothetical protein|tara:strand:+ start:1162 stop:1374 length:213 start_codon:yes stop_codon:yes gene_type:complete